MSRHTSQQIKTLKKAKELTETTKTAAEITMYEEEFFQTIKSNAAYFYTGNINSLRMLKLKPEEALLINEKEIKVCLVFLFCMHFVYTCFWFFFDTFVHISGSTQLHPRARFVTHTSTYAYTHINLNTSHSHTHTHTHTNKKTKTKKNTHSH